MIIIHSIDTILVFSIPLTLPMGISLINEIQKLVSMLFTHCNNRCRHFITNIGENITFTTENIRYLRNHFQIPSGK